MIKITKKLIGQRLLLARCQITATTSGGDVEKMSNAIKADRGDSGPHFLTDGRWAVDIGLTAQWKQFKEGGTAWAAAELGLWDNEAGKPRPSKGKYALCPDVRYMEAGAVVQIAREQAKLAAASLCGEGGKEFKRTEWIRKFPGEGIEGLQYKADDGELMYLDRRIVEGMEPFYFDSVFAVSGKSPAFIQGMPTISEPWKFGIMIMPLRPPEADKK